MKRNYIKPKTKVVSLRMNTFIAASPTTTGAEDPETGEVDPITPGTEDPNNDSRIFNYNIWDD